MAFLDEISALEGDPAAQAALLRTWLATRPRELFDELRPARPILALPGIVLVTRYPDVLEVLSRDRDFGVAAYAPKMHRATGDFFLGMEDGPAYEREVSIMRLASSREDLPRLEQAIGGWADGFVAEKAASGRLDIVGDVSRRVPGRLVADYFGASGPDEATRLRWLRALFRDIFLNPGDRDPAVRDAAALAAADLSVWLDEFIAGLIARAQAGEALPDTVLARCVRMQAAPATALDAIGIRRNIAGIIVGAIDTTSECVANALDFLLDRPELLAAAAAAAKGTLDDVRGFVFEALRFNPQAPFLTRLAARAGGARPRHRARGRRARRFGRHRRADVRHVRPRRARCAGGVQCRASGPALPPLRPWLAPVLRPPHQRSPAPAHRAGDPAVAGAAARTGAGGAGEIRWAISRSPARRFRSRRVSHHFSATHEAAHPAILGFFRLRPPRFERLRRIQALPILARPSDR